MKKWIAALLLLALMSTLCACSLGEETPFEFKKDEDVYTCYGFKDAQSFTADVQIPASYRDKPVRKLGSSAFAEENITSVTLEEGIERIGQSAFAQCKKLESVTLPNSLRNIDLAAFNECGALRQIYIPAGVKELDTWVFLDCTALEVVVIEGELEMLDRESFKGCSALKVIYLPGTLKDISIDALYGCDALEEIHFDGTADEFLGIDFNIGWMSAENVLVCCTDRNILLEDKNTWSETDLQAVYPMDPKAALYNP